MTDERKYQEEEIKEIFDLATNRAEVGLPAVSDEGGLTLAELQEVGLEVGMEPARIAEAALEPTATGDRLRLRTQKGSAMALFTIGAAGLALGLALTTLFVFEDLGRASLVLPVLMAAFGGGTLISNVLRLPSWAREREGQMKYIADQVGTLLGEPSQGEESEV